MNKENTLEELLEVIDQKIENNDVIDSVHKIKLITTRDVIKDMIRTINLLKKLNSDLKKIEG